MSPQLEFLRVWGMVKPSQVRGRVGSLSPQEIEQFLLDYPKAVAREGVRIPRAVSGEVGIVVDSWAEAPPLRSILQVLLYVDMVVLPDPIALTTLTWQEKQADPQYLMKFRTPDKRAQVFAKTEMAPAILRVLQLSALLEAGLVHLVPIDYASPIRVPGAIRASDFISEVPIPGGATDLHPLVERVLLPSVEVLPVQANLQGDFKVLRGAELTPGRTISLQFPDDPRRRLQILSKILPHDGGDPNRFGMVYNPADEVDPEQFEKWVEATRRDVADERARTLQRDLELAAVTRGRFLTGLPLTHRLLGDRGEKSTPSAVLMSVGLPYFGSADPESLVKARRNEVSFHEFRRALDQACKEMEAEPGRADEIIRDLVHAPLAKVEAKVASLRRTLFLDAVVLVGSLGATLASSANPIFAAAALGAAGLVAQKHADRRKDQEEVEQSSGYFYWEAAGRPKRSE